MRERLQRFMMGRNGLDDICRFLMFIWFGLWIVQIFVYIPFSSLLSYAILIYMYFRMFSRNIPKRYRENECFLRWKSKFSFNSRARKAQREQRKTHRIYKCPTCKQKIRIPRGKGRICITCPKCKTEFTKVS